MAKLKKGAFAEGGKGRKPCPFDPSHFVAARASLCPQCGKEIPQKESKPRGRKKTGSPVLDLLTIGAVKELGGVKEIRKRLDEIDSLVKEAGDLADMLRPLGGPEGAKIIIGMLGDVQEALR